MGKRISTLQTQLYLALHGRPSASIDLVKVCSHRGLITKSHRHTVFVHAELCQYRHHIGVCVGERVTYDAYNNLGPSDRARRLRLT